METITGSFADPTVAASWDAVHAVDPAATPFQTRTWLQAWHELRGEDRPLVVRIFCHEGQSVGAVAEIVEPDGRRTLPGGRDVTDYRGPLSAPERRGDVARAWVAALARDGVAEVELHGIAVDTGWLDALAEAGVTVVDRSIEEVCPQVSLDGGHEAYLARVDSQQRREFDRKARRMAREVGPLEVVEARGDELGPAVERFLAMAAEAGGDKGGFFADPQMREFFQGIVAAMAPTGALRVHELMVGGLPAAAMVSLVADGDWGLYNSAFDPALEAYGPGSILIWELIRTAAEEGCRVFDLLRGDEPYKYRFGASDREIEQAVLRLT